MHLSSKEMELEFKLRMKLSVFHFVLMLLGKA